LARVGACPHPARTEERGSTMFAPRASAGKGQAVGSRDDASLFPAIQPDRAAYANIFDNNV